MSQTQQHPTTLTFGRPLDEMRLDRVLPWLVLAVSLAITHQLWQSAHTYAERELQSNFDFRVRETVELVEQRMKAYEQLLHGAKGLFSALASVKRHEFRAFAKEQHLDENYPGIQGIGFALVMPPEQKDRHVAAIRKEGFPGYTIKPEGQRDSYTSIIYREPFSGSNLSAFGYDMYSEPVRRAAMEQARDSGKAAISGKVKLVHETGQNIQAGFLMYLPVYKNGAPHDTLAERRANIIGWIYSTFRTDDLMFGILGERASDLDIEIYDDAGMSPEALLHDSDNVRDAGRLGTRLQSVRGFGIAGRFWTVAVTSMPGFGAQAGNKPQLIASIGAGVSLLLALITWLLAAGRKRALNAAEKMNHELIGSEARTRAFSDNLPAAVYMKDMDGRHVMVNRYFEQVIDKPQAGILGKTVFDLFPAEIARAFAANDRKTLESEQASTYEESVHVDGREHIYQSIKFPIIGEDGEAFGTGGISIDITDRKQAEKEIEFKNTLLSALNEYSLDGTLVVDENEKILFANKRFTDMWGITSDVTDARLDGLVLKPVLDKLADPRQLLEKMEYLDSHRQETTMDELSLKDGRTIDCYSAPIIGPDAKYYGRVRYLRDITRRKQVEEALRTSEERWRFALEGAGDGVWEWNLQTGELIMSKVGKAIFGFAEDEIDNDMREWQARVHPEDEAHLAEDTLAYFQGKDTSFSSEYRLRCKDGSWKWVHARGMAMSRAANGHVLRMIGTHADITERKQAEQALAESEARFRHFFEKNGSVMLLIEPDSGEIVAANQAAAAYYGYPQERLPGMSIGQINTLPPDEITRERQRALHEECNYFNFPHRLASGEVRDVEVYSTPILITSQPMLFSIVHDITERKQAEKDLRASEANLNAILDNSPYMVWLKDTDGRFIKVNQPFFRATGLKQIQDVLGKTDFDLWPREMAEKYRADDAEVMSARQQKLVEEMSIVENGKVQWVETFKTPILDEKGQVLGTTGFAQNITMRKNAEDRIRYLANYDILTDLPNRTLLGDRLQQALATAKRDKARMALMFLDLDQFKPVNDTLGHAVGDLLLKEAAKRMQDCVRESDTVARMGGDEFIVLLPGIETEQDAMVVAEKIRTALNRPFELAGENLRISSSIGIAVYPEHGSEEEMLLRNADTAMYYAKESGRNTVRMFQAGAPENSK